MMAVLTATDREMGEVSAKLRLKSEIADAGLRIRQGVHKGKDIILVRTGMGRKCVERAVDFLTNKYDINSIVSFGVAGALEPNLCPGDVVICRETRCGNVTEADERCTMNAGMVDVGCRAMNRTGANWRQGMGLTVHGAAFGDNDKRLLWNLMRADVCEMEDFWIGRMAASQKIPFFSVRVVMDEQGYSLPSLGPALDTNGTFNPGRAAVYILLHPVLLLKMPGMLQRWRVAGQSLGLAAESILDGLAGEAA